MRKTEKSPMTPNPSQRTPELKCGSCLLPIHPAETGIRHFGISVSHSENRCIELLRAEHAAHLKEAASRLNCTATGECVLAAIVDVQSDLSADIDAAQTQRDEARVDRDKWKAAYEGEKWHLANAVSNVELEVKRNAAQRNNVKDAVVMLRGIQQELLDDGFVEVSETISAICDSLEKGNL